MGLLAGDEAVRRSLVGEVMLPPFACVSADTPVSALMVHFSSPTPAAAVLVDLGGDEMHIITRHDLMAQLS
jgi:predicted transcriptional regulator